MKKSFRYVPFIFLVMLSPSCLAQAVTIRVINANDGSPLQKQPVSVTLSYSKGEESPASLTYETDVNGEIHFALPKPAPERLSAQVRLTSEHWRCGCGVVVPTKTLVQEGVIGPLPGDQSERSAARIIAMPGEILFVARPLSFWERLLYPFVKG
jgi:hypothetical protein